MNISKHQVARKLEKILYFLNSIIYIFYHTPKKPSHNIDCIVMCAKVNRGLLLKGKLYSQLSDALYDDLKNIGVKVVSLSSDIDNFFANTKQYHGHPTNFIYYYRKKYFIYYFKKYFLFQKHNESFNFLMICEILKLYLPKYLISIQPSPSLCKACKYLGIIILDLQHGVIGEAFNKYYSIHDNDSRSRSDWPDYILCWNMNTFNWVNENLQGYSRPILIGNPHLIKFYEDSLIKDLLESFSKGFQDLLYCKRKKVLVTLERKLYIYGYSSEFGLTQDLVNVIKSRQDILWLIKMHPFLMRTNNSNLLAILKREFDENENVEWCETSIAPLALLFKFADLHLTSVSASCIEAALTGLKTGMIADKSMLELLYFSELSNNMIFQLDDDREVIEKFIDSKLDSKSSVSHFDNFYVHYQKFLHDILNKQIV